MSKNDTENGEPTAPYVDNVYCGYCDTECVNGRFGGNYCPDCGRCVSVVSTYQAGPDEQKVESLKDTNK